MAFTKDIVANYGAVGDGSTNDRPSFLAFKAAAAGLDSVLTGPAGKTYKIGARVGGADDDYLFAGIPTLTVDLAGSVITDAGAAPDFHLGGRLSFYEDATHSARIATVAAGAITVQLLTSGDHSKISVGSKVCLAGDPLQSGDSFPINPHFFEFLVVASKQTSTLPYTITFTTALKNAYRSDWPDFASTSTAEVAGPATLYVMPSDHDVVHDYRNFTVDKTGTTRKPTNANGRIITLRGITATNQDGINPTVTELHQLIGFDYSAVTLEVDKVVGTLAFTRGRLGTIHVQSSSVDVMRTDGCAVSGTIVGTPKKTVITNSTTALLSPGSYAGGRSDELIANNSVIGGGIELKSLLYKGGNFFTGQDIGVDNGLNTMTAGVIRIPKSYTASSVSWAVPGTWCWFVDQNRACIRIFQVLSVTDDATYVYIQTSENGTWPSYDSSGGGKLYIRTHPAPRVTFRNCSQIAPAGTNDNSFAWALSQAPAGAPLYSYAKYTATGAAQNNYGNYLIGNLVSLSVTIQTGQHYKGASSLSFSPVGDASGICWVTKADGSLGKFSPSINAKMAGTRLMTIANGVATITGTQSGDSFTAFADIPTWLANIAIGTFSRDISGESQSDWPSITVEGVTDQGITAQRTVVCNFV